ncbi:hypothetical protein [Desulfotalea psychrophila]|uniref:Uncharacterized protein n=1 Tax=Desulfotalea psychrophila (strain LSv54 / DSM 12343) TaxID=177439 RepID=Q6AS62_DESPS|nr:hypothetical protein [Desulfotalea psychrophila]CAG34813.1 unknown protein [Desulfotalea psychrophila LSv54]
MKTQRDTDKKIIALIKMGDKILETAVEGHQKQYLNEKKFHDFRISALSFLSVTFGVTSQFYKEFEKEVTLPNPYQNRTCPRYPHGSAKRATGRLVGLHENRSLREI